MWRSKTGLELKRQNVRGMSLDHERNTHLRYSMGHGMKLRPLVRIQPVMSLPEVAVESLDVLL